MILAHMVSRYMHSLSYKSPKSCIDNIKLFRLVDSHHKRVGSLTAEIGPIFGRRLNVSFTFFCGLHLKNMP